MRLSLALYPDPAVSTTAVARLAERLDFDGLFIPGGPNAWRDPITVAEYVATATNSVRLTVQVYPGLDHPLLLAEALASLDQAANGRLEAMLSPATPDMIARRGLDRETFEDRAEESIAAIRGLWACGLFRFEGVHWSIPAGHESNGDRLPSYVQMTTKPNQLALPVWREVAGRSNLTFERADDLGGRASLVRLEPDMSDNVGILVSLRAKGLAMAICRFPDTDLPESMSLFTSTVVPRLRTVELPRVIVDQLDHQLQQTPMPNTSPWPEVGLPG